MAPVTALSLIGNSSSTSSATPDAVSMATLKTMGNLVDTATLNTWTGSSNVSTLSSTVNGRTLPSSDFVGISDVQTLTNKTIDGSQIVTNSIAYSKLAASAGPIILGQQNTASNNISALSMSKLKLMGNFLDTTWTGSSIVNTLASTVNGLTFPNSNFVGISDVQTLTNKTIDGSQIVNSSISAAKLASGVVPSSYMFRVKDATQVIGTTYSGVYVTVSFPTAVSSNNITYTASGSDFYCTVAEAGRYIVQWALTWNYSTSKTQVATYVQVGSLSNNYGKWFYGSASSSDGALTSSAVLNLVANDVLRIWFMHNDSRNLTNTTAVGEWGYLNIVRIQ